METLSGDALARLSELGHTPDKNGVIWLRFGRSWHTAEKSLNKIKQSLWSQFSANWNGQMIEHKRSCFVGVELHKLSPRGVGVF